MPGSFQFGKIFGIPLYVHYSWIAIFVLITASLMMQFGAEGVRPEWSALQRGAVAAVTSLLFFSSVLVHELGHSVVALKNRIPVVSITLFIFGGAAQISKEADSAKAEAAVAVAGPITSFLLAGLFLLIWATVGRASDAVALGAGWLGLINLMLGGFNLLPGFPLDGGRLLRAIAWGITGSFERATRIAASAGRSLGFGLMAFGGISVLLTGSLGGLWLVLIGWFIENAASAAYAQLQLQLALSGVTASTVMEADFPTVEPDRSIHQLADGILATGKRSFVVRRDSTDIGLITLGGITQVPRDQWPTTRIDQAMVPLEEAVTATPDTPALDVLSALAQAGINQAPVVKDGRVVGLVTRERLLSLVQARAGLRSGRLR